MLLIKFATRSRPQWFRKCIDNIFATMKTREVHVLVTADLDDPTMNNQEIIDFCKHYGVEILFDKSLSKIHAINRDMNLANPRWKWLVNMSDDMQFITQNWDEIMLEQIKSVWGESTDFFAHFSDGYVHDLLPTMSIMGRDYYERDGYIYHPSYKSFSCDAEAMYVAMMRKRHHYFPRVLFLHQHPTQSPHPKDHLYQVNSEATPHDTQNYFNRLVAYFHEPDGHDILKVRPELKKYL